ncbi:hypothetical protein [Cyanobium sp. ATX 6F1]|uniref:hypothetical protein n=1 Tax=unclassified Cyanobium TaxID=2627006 RepID=UPI0020CF09F4|nr:hypothetical protein [Cyanobium sp. ATX 6F1]MCP9915910.1 hypothetical protein [Cyanobium sp. ATX 6F1]
MNDLQRSSRPAWRSNSPVLLACGLATAALLGPVAALAQSQPVIIERTVTTVEYRDDGSRNYGQPSYRPAPVVRQSYGVPVRTKTYRQVYRPTYQVNYEPGYDEPGYAQPYRQAYRQPYRQDYIQPTYGQQGYAAQLDGNAPLTQADAQQQQKTCQIGRLVGGLVGGGVGYAASRQDGRSWAVPLGALLGTQVGCNAAIGKGPTLW